MPKRELDRPTALRLYRRRLLLSTGYGLGSALVPAPLWAQTAGDDGGRSANPQDPAQVLPGPFGPFGGPGGDIPDVDDGTKEDMEQASETTGDIGETLDTVGRGIAGAGGAVAGIGAVTGLGAGVGGVISMIGIVTMGIGAIFNTISSTLGELADDPPRQNYRQHPACAVMPIPQFATTQPVPAPLTTHANAAAAFLAEAASCLAALELWGGAVQARDGEWMANHRTNFVTRFNAMGERGVTAAATGPAAVDTILDAMNDAGLTLAQMREHVWSNGDIVTRWGQQQNRALLEGLASQCGEIARVARIRRGRGERIAPDQLASRYQALQQLMRGLPTYSQIP